MWCQIKCKWFRQCIHTNVNACQTHNNARHNYVHHWQEMFGCSMHVKHAMHMYTIMSGMWLEMSSGNKKLALVKILCNIQRVIESASV